MASNYPPKSPPATPAGIRASRLVRPLVLMAFATAAQAQAQAPSQGSDSSPAMYLQYGAAERSADSWTLGITLPWRHWQRSLWGGQVTGYWDLWAGRWSAPLDGRDRSTSIIGVNPTLRWRGDAGQSPWFAEAGVGLSWALNRRYVSDSKEFATRYNFATHLGVGYLFGAQRQHELVLRLEHHSNAGIKKPNPGENFLQLRYARHF